jgi:hypothetical protein
VFLFYSSSHPGWQLPQNRKKKKSKKENPQNTLERWRTFLLLISRWLHCSLFMKTQKKKKKSQNAKKFASFVRFFSLLVPPLDGQTPTPGG